MRCSNQSYCTIATMYKSLILLGLVAVVYCAPAEDVVPIVSQESSVDPDGKFHWSYESGDGTKQVQDGELKVLDKDVTAEVIHGSYAYKADDGQVYEITYVADENGYQPQGAHLPVAPPIPETIQRALAYLATAPPPKE